MSPLPSRGQPANRLLPHPVLLRSRPRLQELLQRPMRLSAAVGCWHARRNHAKLIARRKSRHGRARNGARNLKSQSNNIRVAEASTRANAALASLRSLALPYSSKIDHIDQLGSASLGGFYCSHSLP